MKNYFYLFLLLVFTSCEGDQTVKYVFTDLQADHLTSENGANDINTNSQQASATYGIRCNLSPVETYRKGRYFDPYESSVNCEDPVEFVLITATADFDSEHPQGSLLNDLFYYNPGNLRDVTFLENDSLAPYIDMRHLPTYPTSNFPEYADFMLENSIGQATDISFIVHLITQNGDEFIDTTSTIQLH